MSYFDNHPCSLRRQSEMLTVPLPLLVGIGPAVETMASAPPLMAGRIVSRSASKPPWITLTLALSLMSWGSFPGLRT